MSGGDGKDHNSGAHDSGGSINGTSGKGGPDSGGGYWDNHPHITITGGQEVGQGGAGINWGGGSGHGNGGGSVAIPEYNTGKYPNTGGFPPIGDASWQLGVSWDIENYCTLRLFFDLSTLAGLSRRNLPEAGIRLLFHI